MGNTSSSSLHSYPDASCAQMFSTLGITSRTAQVLYRKFTELTCGENLLHAGDFYRGTQLLRTPFNERVFVALDVDGSGSLTFRDFAISLFSFLFLDEIASIRFAYYMLDTSTGNGGSGVGLKDFTELLAAAYGENWSYKPPSIIIYNEVRTALRCEDATNTAPTATTKSSSHSRSRATIQTLTRPSSLPLREAVKLLTFLRRESTSPPPPRQEEEEKKTSPPSLLTFEEFSKIAQSHPFLMLPIVCLSNDLRQVFGGKYFWESLARKSFRRVRIWSAFDLIQAKAEAARVDDAIRRATLLNDETSPPPLPPLPSAPPFSPTRSSTSQICRTEKEEAQELPPPLYRPQAERREKLKSMMMTENYEFVL